MLRNNDGNWCCCIIIPIPLALGGIIFVLWALTQEQSNEPNLLRDPDRSSGSFAGLWPSHPGNTRVLMSYVLDPFQEERAPTMKRKIGIVLAGIMLGFTALAYAAGRTAHRIDRRPEIKP